MIQKHAALVALVLACLALLSPLAAQEPKLRRTFSGHKGAAGCVAISPDGKVLASGGRDEMIRLWDIASGKEKAKLKTAEWWTDRPFPPVSLAFRRDGKMVAAGIAGDVVRLWDLAVLKDTTLQNTSLFQSTTWFTAPHVLFSPDGKTVATGGNCDMAIRLFDVATGKERATFTVEDVYGVRALTFTPDGKTLISLDRVDGIKLWDVATGKNTAKKEIADADDVFGAAFSSDAKTLATVIWVDLGKRLVAKEIKLLDVATGKEKMTLKGHMDDLLCVVFSPDGKTLATASKDGTIKLWDVAKGKEFASIKEDHTAMMVLCLAFSANSKMLVSGSKDKTIKLWDVAK